MDKLIWTLLLLFCCLSCRETRPESNGGKEFAGSEDSQSLLNPNFISNYNLVSLPDDYYRQDSLTVEIDHNELAYITYIVGFPECEGSYSVHSSDEEIFIDLANVHGTVRFCFTGIDVNGEEEGRVHVHKWTQGFPELVNKTIISGCMPIESPDVSIKLAISFSQDLAGGVLSKNFEYKVFSNSQCEGDVLQIIPLDVSNVSLSDTLFSFDIGSDQWQLQMFFDETNSISHFQTIEADGSEGLFFLYEEESP